MITRRDALLALMDVSVLAFMPNTVARLAGPGPFKCNEYMLPMAFSRRALELMLDDLQGKGSWATKT